MSIVRWSKSRWPMIRTGISVALALVVLVALVFAVKRAALGPAGPTSRDGVAISDTTIIDGEVASCADCSLISTLFIPLGTPRDRDIPQRVPEVVRDSRGTHYLVFNGWVNKPILKYDSAGRYIGRLGNYGKGPGEYSMTHTVFVGAGDSLFVFDWDRRFLVFSPDGRYQRSIRVPSGIPIGLGPGGLLYSQTGHRRNWRFEDHRVLLIDPNGTVRDSFPIFAVTTFNASRPVLGRDGSLWTYMPRSYRLERHGPDGTVAQLLGVVAPPERTRPAIMTSVEADSFRAHLELLTAKASTRRVVSPKIRPTPQPAMSMMVDSTGLLWVIRNIAAPRWDTLTITPEHLAPNEAPGETTIPRDQEDRMYHSIVEVIDPRSAQLLARTTLPFLGMLAAPGWVARVTADTNGQYRTEVHRVELRRGATTSVK